MLLFFAEVANVSEHLGVEEVFLAVIGIIVCLEGLMVQPVIFDPIVDRTLNRNGKIEMKRSLFSRDTLRCDGAICGHSTEPHSSTLQLSTIMCERRHYGQYVSCVCHVCDTAIPLASEIRYDDVEINSFRMELSPTRH